jgi:hypothetical protein
MLNWRRMLRLCSWLQELEIFCCSSCLWHTVQGLALVWSTCQRSLKFPRLWGTQWLGSNSLNRKKGIYAAPRKPLNSCKANSFLMRSCRIKTEPTDRPPLSLTRDYFWQSRISRKLGDIWPENETTQECDHIIILCRVVPDGHSVNVAGMWTDSFKYDFFPFRKLKQISFPSVFVWYRRSCFSLPFWNINELYSGVAKKEEKEAIWFIFRKSRRSSRGRGTAAATLRVRRRSQGWHCAGGYGAHGALGPRRIGTRAPGKGSADLVAAFEALTASSLLGFIIVVPVRERSWKTARCQTSETSNWSWGAKYPRA